MAISNEIILVIFGYLIIYLTMWKYSRFMSSMLFLAISIVSLLNATTEGIYGISMILIVTSLILLIKETIELIGHKN